MNMLQNRHVKIAMVVAPMLGLATYAAVDYSLKEKPATATAGQSYPLVELPSCRYDSGHCTLKNGDVTLRIRSERMAENRVRLTVSSELPLGDVLVAVGQGQKFTPPVSGSPWSEGLSSIELTLTEPKQHRFRWAFSIHDAAYFAETSAAFVEGEVVLPERNVAAQ